jgi:hypothetical protein
MGSQGPMGFDPYTQSTSPGQQQPQQQVPYQQGQNPAMDMMLRQANVMSRGGGGFGNPRKQNVPKPTTPNQPAPNSAPQNMPTPGRNGYTPTTAPAGMDMTNPGVQQQFWHQNQNLWMQPPGGQDNPFGGKGAGQQFWNQVQGGFNQSQQSLQPQFDAAFDRARDNTVGAMNQQAAARGAYGSSSALNGVGNAIAGIEAQRGQAATDFALKNAANQRDNLSAYGNLAFGAGQEAMAGSNEQLNRLNSAYLAAGQAERARNNQIQGQFDNTFNYTNMVLPWASGQYESAFDADQGAFSAGQDARLGASANRAAGAQQGYNNFMGGINQGLNFAGGVAAFDQMGGFGGNSPPPPPAGQPFMMPSPFYNGG